MLAFPPYDDSDFPWDPFADDRGNAGRRHIEPIDGRTVLWGTGLITIALLVVWIASIIA